MKKLLSIIIISLFILNLSSCGAKENPLVIDGRADAEKYAIFSPYYTKNHPLNKCFETINEFDRYYQNKNIDKSRKIMLEKKTYTLTYKESAHYDFYDADIYYSDDESFSVTYYSGTTTIASIQSIYFKEPKSLFPLETLFSIEAKFATEEDYINYSRQLAEILGVDISDSYTEGYTYTGYSHDTKGFLTDDQLDGKKAKVRGMDWVMPYKNGLICHTGKFNIRCDYIPTDSGEDKPILTSISFPVPFPDDVFEVSDNKVKELIKSIHSDDYLIEIEEYSYRIVFTNLLTLAVVYSYEDENGMLFRLGAYIFPEDTVFPE